MKHFIKSLLVITATWMLVPLQAQPSKSLWISDIAIGYASPQKSGFNTFMETNPTPKLNLGGVAATFSIWRHAFYYGEGKKFFDVGASIRHMSLANRTETTMSPDGLAILNLLVGVRHSMYFIKHNGFEQSVLVGIALPTEAFLPLHTSPMIGGHFGYFHPVFKHISLGARWNWNFMWFRTGLINLVYANVFDIAVRIPLDKGKPYGNPPKND